MCEVQKHTRVRRLIPRILRSLSLEKALSGAIKLRGEIPIMKLTLDMKMVNDWVGIY